MAISPSSQYPGKTTVPDTEYPLGGARNVTTPGDGTGTPWEAALLNDILGMQQAFLSAAGLTPSGTPDNALASQYLEALLNLTARRATYVLSNDGVTDNSAAFTSLLQLGEIDIYLDKGVYAVSAQVAATLAGNVTLRGPGVIKWTGAAITGPMFTITCSGNSFEYYVGTDGNNLAPSGWRVVNTSPMTAALPTCRVSGKFKNCRATLAGSLNTFMLIEGSFELVDIHANEVAGPTRAAGLVVATQSIVYADKDDIYWAKAVQHHSNVYSGIASDDVGAADIDTDYFVCFMPNPTNFPNGDGTFNYGPTVPESYGNTYNNPIGRSEKWQCFANSHDNNVVRDGDSGGRTLLSGGSVDFNFQLGAGICKDQTITLLGQVTSPLTTDYSPVSFFQGTDYGERSACIDVDGMKVVNQINSSVNDEVKGLVGFTKGAWSMREFGTITLQNIHAVGGTVEAPFTCSFGENAIGVVNMRNVTGAFTRAVLEGQDDCDDVTLIAEGVVNLSGSDVDFFGDTAGGDRAFRGKAYGQGNFGIKQTYTNGATGGRLGSAPMLNGAALADELSTNDGGSLSVQSGLISDDAVRVFNVRGFLPGSHIITVSSDFAGYSGVFACTGASSTIVEMTVSNINAFALGAGTNPDTDGKINLWVDGDGKLNIKNRLGSARRFTVSFMG